MASSSVLLDVLSYIEEIKSACGRVQSSKKAAWALLGYIEGDSRTKAFNLYTLNVISEGNVWMHMFQPLRNDKIMYAYVKLTDLKDQSGRSFETFLIHWVGEGADENEIAVCMPHLNEVRNIIPAYDHLVTANRIENLHRNVLTYITESQHITTRPDSTYLDFPFPFQLKTKNNQTEFVSSVELAKYRTSLDIESLSILTNDEFHPAFPEPLTIKQTPSAQSINPSVKRKRDSIPKFKVTLLGESGVGKTSIYCCFDKGYPCMPAATKTTIPADYTKKKFEVGENKFYMEIWDTAGQERFRGFASSWLRDSKVVILVYDITDELSFVKIIEWLEMAKQFSDLDAIYVLVGNKVDLEARRVVAEARAVIFAEREGLIHIECSGLTGYNIVNLFNQIARRTLVVYPHKFTRKKMSNISQENSGVDDLIALDSDRERISTKSKEFHKTC